MKALTLVEILIIVALLAILASFTFPMGLDFYRSQQLETKTQEVIQTLRRAQLKAISQELDSNYGVYFTQQNYILFKGNSYLTRDSQYDEIFNFSAIMNISGLNEITFSRLEGKPSVTGNIVLSSNGNTATININEIGRINLEI